MKKISALCFAALLLVFFLGCAKHEVTTSAPAETKQKISSGRYRVGVILPLTGKQRIYGESTLHGIECAVGVFSPCDRIIDAELIVKDDQSDPNLAVAAVDELVKKDNVSVILGPLSSSSIEPAARRAQELGVPLISLSQLEGTTQIGDAIFSVALTSNSQAEKIIEWAVKNKQAKNFAILYPMNAYGQKFKAAFAEAVASNRGKIIKAEGYGEATADFGGFFTGDAKFDALFIPDSYRAVAYIAASIPFGYLDNVQLLGNNRWNNSELAERGADYVAGAVFVDGYFNDSPSVSVRKFSGAFEETYKIKPTILEAQAFDAMRLAAKALQLTGGEHAADMKQTLQTIPDVEGSTGQIGFDSNREIIRKLFLLTVADGKITELGTTGGPLQKDKYGDPIKQ